MATIINQETRRKSCPVCGTKVDEISLARAEMSKEQLQILKKHRDNGTLGHLIHIVDIFAGKINAEQMLQESDLKQTITLLEKVAVEVKGDMTEIVSRLGGTAIGKIGETVTIKDLKSLCPSDDFSDEVANKGGSDIVSTINEKEQKQGIIVVSVKYDVQWKNEHLKQLRKNMKQEETPFGILVTKDFPKQALNEKAYVISAKTNEMIMLVKPEYAPVAYYGFRQAVIAWKEAYAKIEDEKSRIQEHKRVTNAVIDWVSGKGFHHTTTHIDAAVELSEDSSRMADKIKSYTTRELTKIQETQEKLRSDLNLAKSAVQELKDILDGKNDDSSQT